MIIKSEGDNMALSHDVLMYPDIRRLTELQLWCAP